MKCRSERQKASRNNARPCPAERGGDEMAPGGDCACDPNKTVHARQTAAAQRPSPRPDSETGAGLAATLLRDSDSSATTLAGSEVGALQVKSCVGARGRGMRRAVKTQIHMQGTTTKVESCASTQAPRSLPGTQRRWRPRRPCPCPRPPPRRRGWWRAKSLSSLHRWGPAG